MCYKQNRNIEITEKRKVENIMKNGLKEREITFEERKIVEETLEKKWREFEKKLIEHIPENKKYLYISSKSCFELSSDKVLVDKDGIVYFFYKEIGGESSFEGRICNGKLNSKTDF